VIPIAFAVVSEEVKALSQETRRRCRDFFIRDQTLKRLVAITEYVVFGDQDHAMDCGHPGKS
ncbi:MAG: hypothetical protein ACYDDA_11200, partial [Acidiferrobacteraceae bacterium]